jgi:uncharacterized protein (DUF1015 family)
MPSIRPIPAIGFDIASSRDLSSKIAPPYDVLDASAKAALLQRDPHNIVAVDLPHLPAKTVGPDSTYHAAGELYRQWLAQGVLVRRDRPAMFVYQQTYAARGQTFKRKGLIANVRIQPFGKPQPAPGATQAAAGGGIYPHEQTFSGPKEDRLKLMRATQAQLSPIFGLHSDPDQRVGRLLGDWIAHHEPTFTGRTGNDDVLHEAWAVDDAAALERFTAALSKSDVFIADGHHRYTTALNHKNELEAVAGKPLPPDHPAASCLFVLVALQDPGMIILPTHRVLGNMPAFSMAAFTEASAGKLKIVPFPGRDLAALERALPSAGPHAMGLYDPAGGLAIATTVDPDPLAKRFADKSKPWRQLDVAIVQHLIVEEICVPRFVPAGQEIAWKFPHTLEDVVAQASHAPYKLGVVVQATPLEAVRQISEANELMPQKSTFFYPKLATGLVINPLS